MDLTRYREARLLQLDRSLWTSIRAFAATVGKWWLSVWVLLILSGIVAFGLTVANVKNFPTPLWAGLLLAGLIVAPTVAFHQMRIDRDSFKQLWEDREAIVRILAELEELRSEGADLQIKGRASLSKDRAREWSGLAKDWYQRVISKLVELHPAEAGKFRTLGIYTPRLVTGPALLSLHHTKDLQNLVRRLDILAEIRERWTT